jgi:CTP:molybdopterin cytidylyltransferase MocA
MKKRSTRSRVKSTKRVAARRPSRPSLLPYLVSVIIPAMNESKRIGAVIRQARRLHAKTEVIVVVNGSKDGTERISRELGAKVIRYGSPLGHDVGRAIGAIHATGDILLFLDGDMAIPASDLKPFVQAVADGADVAINSYSGFTRTDEVHHVVLAKHVLNVALSKPELQGSSMTTVPHAMSRKALELIGTKQLAVPPLAQAIATAKGLKVERAHYVDVGRRKNPRKRTEYKIDPLVDLIVGDHLEAIGWLLKETGPRGQFTDLARDRTKAG